jgi:hypothetical protein
MKKLPALCWIALAAFVVAGAATERCVAGSTIIRHSGGRNPVTEGWLLIDESSGMHHFGPVKTAPPPLPERRSWWIDTETNGAAGLGAYQSTYPAIADAWKVRVVLRAEDIDTLGGQAVHVGTGIPFSGGGNLHFKMRFGMSADGDPTVAVGETGLPIEIDGGANEFHSYELHVDMRHNITISNFLVDGVLRGDAGAYGDPENFIGIEWGDLDPSSAVSGSALWNVVNFRNAIPEPNGVVLAGLAMTMFACRRDRKRLPITASGGDGEWRVAR